MVIVVPKGARGAFAEPFSHYTDSMRFDHEGEIPYFHKLNKFYFPRKAFLGRKEKGLGLSDRVWRYTTEFKNEIELGLDVGIRNGSDAAKMARELNTFLQNPDKLFRRVRDEHGMLKLSKAAKGFHPGQGVYRSSYKNARRLAATETNMAYRTADYERWQQMDFVVGIEIHLSNNHTCLGRDGKPHPFTDICDELQGVYPKDFKFTGWHPHCRCYATAIFKTDEEFKADEERMLRGEEPTAPEDSENAVNDMPKQFNDWIEEHREQIELSRLRGNEPYFLRDNFNGGTIEGGLKAGIAATMKGAAATSKPIKNNSKPCTDYDTEISTYKKWAYALGLDVTKLDVLRLEGNATKLRAELNTIKAVAETRKEQWTEQGLKLAKFIFDMKRNGLADLESKYTQILQANEYDYRHYYGQSIPTLLQATIDAEKEYNKAIRTGTPLDDLIEGFNKQSIAYREVKAHTKQPTEAKIIERLGGGDRTKGSCSSLAFAYAGQKAGFDVLDFRDGTSRSTFASMGTIKEVVQKSGGIIEKHTNDFTKAHNLLATTTKGKEYYFTCGKHVAIVRKTDTGFEYLELQTRDRNGWKPLTDKELRSRFGALKSHTVYGTKIETSEAIIDIELLKKNTGFKKMLGYINTAEAKQNKGVGGTAK